MNIIQKPSPNHSARPEGAAISAIVLHADAGKSELGTIAWVLNPESKVSYHYLVGRHGIVYQFVQDVRRAWHAGPSSFAGEPNCNNYALGVSFANDQAGEPFPDDQIDAGIVLVADLCRAHGIGVNRITTHSAIALPEGRKRDPGPLFNLPSFLGRVAAILAETT